MFVELETRHGDGLTVTLQWDRATGLTQIVVLDARSDGLIAFGVPPAKAADAFRHPFSYAPSSSAPPTDVFTPSRQALPTRGGRPSAI